ncbi:MAG: adenosylmethionine--8-amino-7-oxononanoate transaminase [Holosporales bacterium]|jgi:adenosylmethionine-8-amino-7-oxononanoate aminotransferase|nr:adenosylmethionine--8-amino-7-oxononanoate transaminase [Holosporales bacterium]
MAIWRPFTQEKTASPSVKISRGSGAHLFAEDGRQYIDMISSWWVNILGHANKEIADAIYKQACILEHVIFAGFSHAPAEELCDKLAGFLPKQLRRFFFSDDGSTAVEVALKMAYQYFKNQGISGRNIYINLEGAYHGDTIGAMSAAGNDSQYHSTFSEFFFKTFTVSFPNTIEEEEASLEKLKCFLDARAEHVCALIVEPLVQGAAGMKMYRAEFLEKIVDEVRKYGILVIFDEVMTGFFRTGTMFAMDQTGVIPDLICLSKGITGGFLPLALTIATDSVYEAFYSDDWKKAFIHGHSYTANPIACAAAIKSLEILHRAETQSQILNIAKTHRDCLAEGLPNVTSKRTLGTIAAFEFESSQQANDVSAHMFRNGVIVRPLQNTMYFIPPYCISVDDLQYAYSLILRDE